MGVDDILLAAGDVALLAAPVPPVVKVGAVGHLINFVRELF